MIILTLGHKFMSTVQILQDMERDSVKKFFTKETK